MVKNKPTSTDDSQVRAVIQARLRRGDISLIAAYTGYDRSHVSRVIKGDRNNPAVLKRAYATVGRRKIA